MMKIRLNEPRTFVTIACRATKPTDVPHVNLGKQQPANCRSLGALDKEVGTAIRMPGQIRCRVAVTSHYPVAP
jgi:hypothetical protein